MANVPTQPRRSARRWVRFSLRSLLLFMTLLCVILGIWLERARRQHEIVTAIRDAGGYVEYEVEDAKAIPPPAPFWHAAPYGQDLADCVESVTIDDRRLLPHVARLNGVKTLTVADSALCDDDLNSIQRMYGLKSIRLLGDEHGGFFSGNPGLHRINESYFHDEAQLSDLSLPILATVQSLEEIVIHGGDYSKPAIQELARLRNLRVLYVDFGDRAKSRPEKDWVAPFEKMPQLESLTLLSPPSAVYTESTRPWAVKDTRDWINENY